ncbi:chloride channel protein [Panacibacter ginsenosidivorans]|uniref:Chloride channel protein n=1 Tax=Panacibacter ginsenosidivorans TaxID=1813871 RepID=A0A5B8VAX6_9BACT|nr:chloride channel protein [Panacibacter ginsenosidivorans]QEC68041.1 chloride channel protein [Panacibacter ginsenosidivorans]
MQIIRFVRKKIKDSFDNIRNERVKKNILQAIPFWLGSIITGLVAVFYAKLFAYAETGSIYIYDHASWCFFILTPTCFVLGWWLVKKYAPYSRGSGIPQVIAAIELANPRHNEKVDRLLSLRIIIIKIFSSLLVVFSGGIIGREGPTIQIAGSVFRKINQWLPAWWPKISRQNMIMTGAAAGLAAAFNTPLGGIVFAVEELTKTHISYFKTALFTAVIIAGLTAQAFLGPYLYLGYPNVNGLSKWVFFPVLLVAFIAGLSGSAMSKLMLALFKWKAGFRYKYQFIFYAIVCALVIASLGYFIGKESLGSGKELMATKLFTADKYAHWYEPLIRMAGSVVTFTTGVAGGVFAPALAAGASIGSVISGWFNMLPADANLLILCGMVAFLTGVTRTPFTSAILVLEMTDRHNVIFYLMLAGMVAGLVSLLIDKRSFYEHLKHQYIHELHKENIKTHEVAVPAT